MSDTTINSIVFTEWSKNNTSVVKKAQAATISDGGKEVFLEVSHQYGKNGKPSRHLISVYGEYDASPTGSATPYFVPMKAHIVLTFPSFKEGQNYDVSAPPAYFTLSSATSSNPVDVLIKFLQTGTDYALPGRVAEGFYE
jgi:hypothetical protein